MSQNAKPKFVGVDDGHYAIKVVTEDGKAISVPSRAKSGKYLISVQGGNQTDGGIYTTEENHVFTVSSNLGDPQDTRTRDYPRSELNRVLVHHGLRAAGLGGEEVNIVTGLPVSHYYLASERNHRLINAKKENLFKGVKADHGELAIIKSNDVTTEAIAAYFDQLMNMDGSASAEYSRLSSAAVGVIDIGGRTTDCAVILPGGEHVDSERSGSGDIGMLNLNRRVEAYLRSEHDFDEVPPALIESALMTGQIKVFGKVVDVSSKMIEFKEQLAHEIMSEVSTKIGTGRDLEAVLLVGGGSIIMHPFFAKFFPNALIPEQPEFSNARGMLKIAKYVMQGE